MLCCVKRSTAARPKLPESWRTDDDPTRAAHELHRLVGPDSAFVRYAAKWWVLRYLDPHDKMHTDVNGHTREQDFWRRKAEVIGAGRTLAECVFQLRGGACRAMVGKGFRVVHDSKGDWKGFVGADGINYADMPIVGETRGD